MNRVWDRRGGVFAERYHVRGLKTPREVRNAIAYVVQNARKHAEADGQRLSRYWIDPYSSGIWFDAWRSRPQVREPWMRELEREECPTRAATTWLLATGWRRWGLLAINEVPGTVRSGA